MTPDVPTQPERQEGVVPKLYIALGIIGTLLLALLLIFGIVWLAQNHPAEVETVRDIFIIALALESCLFGIILMLMLVMIIRLVNTLEFEIKPILEQTNETISTVRGTTNFVSHNVVQPVVTASGYLAGFRRGLKVLFGNPKKNLPD